MSERSRQRIVDELLAQPPIDPAQMRSVAKMFDALGAAAHEANATIAQRLHQIGQNLTAGVRRDD